MTESKIELVQRWRCEGRAEEAARYRDGVRERLRGQGKTRKEAREGSWEAARAAFPPPQPAENLPELAPAVRATEPADEEGYSAGEKQWVAANFNYLPDIADWQATHDVMLSNDALRDLLWLFGYYCQEAWVLGTYGERPEGGDIAHVAAMISVILSDWSEALTVEDLAGLRATEPAPAGQ